MTQSLKTKDGRFGYEAAGDPDKTPLVFLHGIGGAARA
jgi:3-oxoadipate enol-lactonase